MHLCTNTRNTSLVSVDEVRLAYLRNENSCRRRTGTQCGSDRSFYRPCYIVGYTSQDRTLCAVLKGSAGLFVVDVGGDFDSLSVRKVRLIREVCRCACALACTEEQHDDNIR